MRPCLRFEAREVFCTIVRREMNNGLRLYLIVHLLLDQEIEHLHARPFSVCRTVLSSRSEERLKSVLHLQMAICLENSISGIMIEFALFSSVSLFLVDK